MKFKKRLETSFKVQRPELNPLVTQRSKIWSLALKIPYYIKLIFEQSNLINIRRVNPYWSLEGIAL